MGAIPFGANGGRQSYADASRHSDDIVKLLKKNMAVAQAVGFQGLPATLVGVYKVNEALDEKGFERVIADARARQKAKG
jgi:protein-disulfide isomerase